MNYETQKVIYEAAMEDVADFHFNWEMLEDPEQREAMEDAFKIGAKVKPVVESLLQKVSVSTEFTANEQLFLEMLLEKELYSVYKVQGIAEKYQVINNITEND